MADEPKFAPIEVYLTVRGGDAASKFYQEAFGATETFRALADDGKRLMHCNLSMFGGQAMLSDEFPEFQSEIAAPPTHGGTSVTININFADAEALDSAVARAEQAGGRVTMPPGDMFWGARYSRLMDPFGHSWSFSAPIAKKT